MKELPLSQGKIALVSDDDFDRCNQFKWSATHCPDGRTGKHSKWYAHRKEKRGAKWATVYLHRFIMSTPSGMVVDHLDNNGLNCQRDNMTNTFQKINCTRGKR